MGSIKGRICEECSAVYFPIRSNQAVCSDACRDRRKYRKHAERYSRDRAVDVAYLEDRATYSMGGVHYVTYSAPVITVEVHGPIAGRQALELSTCLKRAANDAGASFTAAELSDAREAAGRG